MSRTAHRQAAVLTLAAAMMFTVPGPAFASSPSPGVDPQVVDLTLAPGQSSTVKKTVTAPAVLPKPDIYFLSDVTGSMAGAINNVKANANSILSTVKAAASDAQFGAGQYRDFPYDSPPYATDHTITGDVDEVTGAINSWAAYGGMDLPEANLYALHRVVTDAGFRSGSSKIVVWFGDAPGHDPVCPALTGESAAVTEASVTAELKAAGIKVIAVSVTSGFLGLDGDPVPYSVDYLDACGAPGGSAGQASRITEATGGTFFNNVDPSEVSAKILEGLTALDSTISAMTTCDSGLSLAFSPSLPQTVPSGQTLTLTETVKAAGDATAGEKKCVTHFLINGVDAGDAFTQTVIVKVNTPPDCDKAAASVTTLWPPDHTLKTVTFTVPDPDGDAVTTTVTAVTQDEALNGLGDGDTAPDAVKVAGRSDQVDLRAERSSTGDGRVYRITVSAKDGIATCTTDKLRVSVPHNENGTAIDTTDVVVNSFGS